MLCESSTVSSPISATRSNQNHAALYMHIDPRGAARRAQMLFPLAPLHGTCTITWQRTRVLYSTSTVRVIVAHRVRVQYCSRILLRTGFRIMRGVTSSISPITSSFTSYRFVMFSFNLRNIPTHQHDVIARWRLNPYNPCDQAECLLTSYRGITH